VDVAAVGDQVGISDELAADGGIEHDGRGHCFPLRPRLSPHSPLPLSDFAEGETRKGERLGEGVTSVTCNPLSSPLPLAGERNMSVER
jgi:hypothetical protein